MQPDILHMHPDILLGLGSAPTARVVARSRARPFGTPGAWPGVPRAPPSPLGCGPALAGLARPLASMAVARPRCGVCCVALAAWSA